MSGIGNKRKRSPSVKSKPKKGKKGSKPVLDSKLSAENNFSLLQDRGEEDSDSDSGIIYDYNKKENKKSTSDLILLDSSDSDSDTSNHKKRKIEDPEKEVEENSLANNEDFIEFGFSSTDDEEEDDEENEDEGEEDDRQPNSLYPWIKDHDHSKQKEIVDWLTMEIKDFVDYISPSSEEIIIRNNVIGKLKKEISRFWPGTEVHVFGSCATDLYLPGSDIDMVVVSDTGDYESRPRLYQLSSFLRAGKLATDMEVIAGAKVPIIKFVDPVSQLNIDVSFERTNGIDAAKRIRRWLVTTPGLREMVLVVKQFLRSRRLNNVHVGGLGGYATIIILHPKLSTSSMDPLQNLGVLLIEFFELYGRNFSFDNLLLSLDRDTEEPRYEKKSKFPTLCGGRGGSFTIVIQDPSDPHNNITRSSYNLSDLKKAFGGAYQLLVERCYYLNSASYKQRLGQSILGDIIKYKGKQRDFNDDRHKVVNHSLINFDTGLDDGEEDDEESDGNDGNDKYYFSDMTVESEEDIKRGPTPLTNKAKDNKKLVEKFLGIKNESQNSSDNDDDGEQYDPTVSKQKSNLDKQLKRDYWKQKGLDI
ncbi:TRF5 Poly(A) RNA polymerase protein 1 [Candida maltosa Xu316]